MKTSSEFQETVYGYWARRFDCDREAFVHPGTLVIREEQLAETNKIYIYHIDKMSVVRAAPALAKQAGLPDGYDRNFGSLTTNILQASIQVQLESSFLDYFLDPNDFRCFTVESGFTTRQLDVENDKPYLFKLYEACTETELDAADINVDEPDPVIYGMFDGSQLTAYASHRYWEDVIADIGVLIHPSYRGRGLGKAVVSALCEWCLKNDKVPMYRVFSSHVHSCKLAEALGFKQLVVIETLQVIDKKGTA